MKLLPAITYLLPVVLLSACTGHSSDRPSAPIARPPERGNPFTPSAQLEDVQQCFADLRSAQVRFTPLPDRQYEGGCSTLHSVKLLDIGTPVTNLGVMTCPLAKRFVAWIRYGVQPAARLIMGSELVRVESYGTYSCRPIAGSSKLSEHAHSNAVDIAAFVFTDGQRVSLKDNWRGSGRDARFLSIVHQSACKRFKTAISPDYNSAHHDHFHFDMGGSGGFCR